MGFFSWKTSDTHKSISNRYSAKKALPVYLITPSNEKIYEPNYEGYGIFGGYDAYALLGQWNKPELCTGDEDHDCDVGIECEIENRQKGNLKYPLKFAENPKFDYEDLEPAESCRYQGYFY